MTKTGSEKRSKGHDRARFAWLWRSYCRVHAWMIVLALVLMAIEGIALGVLSSMMEPMFDRVFVDGDVGAMYWVALVIFGTFFARALANLAQKVIMARVSELMAAALRGDLLQQVLTLDSSFHQSHSPGYMIERVQGDAQQITMHAQTLLTGLGRDLITLIVLLGVAMSVDWVWTLVALIGLPLLFGPAAALQRYIRKKSTAAREIAGRMSLRLDEIFHGINPIKLNSLERYQNARYGDLQRQRVRAEVKGVLGRATIPAMLDIVAGLGFVGVLVYGGSEIIAGEKSVGQFMTFFTAIALTFDPMRRLGALSGLAQTLAASLDRVYAIFEMRPSIVSPPEAEGLPQATDVAFEDVHLSYGETAVLRGLSFRAEAGKTTAIVGPSGAGKSTIFNVLTRLVDPDQGRVTLGGVPLSDLDLAALRAQFSMVTQDALLFDESLRENILLGREDVDDDALADVLKAAHLSEFVASLPAGLETEAGPRGSNLSGGQRQRMAIARALLRKTPILLLDEATSALDAQSETSVQAALDALSSGRTTLVIAHRLSTIRAADNILVLSEGEVIEQGTHEALLAKGGAYAQLHELQFKTKG